MIFANKPKKIKVRESKGAFRKLRWLAPLLGLMILLSSCAALDFAQSLVIGLPSGDITALNIGETTTAAFRDITITSVELSPYFHEYEARDGYLFMTIELTETNRYNEEIPLSPYDYYVDGYAFGNFVYPNEVDKGYSGYRDSEQALAPEESQSWTLPFVVPVTDTYTFTHVEHYAQGLPAYYILTIDAAEHIPEHVAEHLNKVY